ncbi:MAG: HAD family hydrolase [Alphaproteobacteria bacterium]|jgi:D-glycero-D-manno-heptose 1,7-bisphosphate phosphatase|nr:HAD family hydrolase [Alphaproteobacteria bacterium]
MTTKGVHSVTEGGMWRQSFYAPPADTQGPRPALFVDRDGTLIELVPYLCESEKMKLIAPAVMAVRQANAVGIPVVVVTNQSGIERGYYDWKDFAAVQQAMVAELERAGAKIDAVYACASHPARNAPCRKPNPGMLLAAAEDNALDLSTSWILGDAATDLQAGKAAGLPKGWLAPGGYGTRDRERAHALACDTFSVCTDNTFNALAKALNERSTLAP